MDQTLAQSGSSRSILSAFMKRFGLLLVYFILTVGLSLLSDRFLTSSNQINIFRQATINGMISVGMTLVILTAGIDLSVGSVLALSAVIGADILKRGIPVPVAVLAALGVGALAGLVNGIIITRGKSPPFIATLGMLTVARCLTLFYTVGQPFTGFPSAFRQIGAGVLGPIPTPIIIALFVFVAVSIILGW